MRIKWSAGVATARLSARALALVMLAALFGAWLIIPVGAARAQTKPNTSESLVASGVDENGRVRLVPNKSIVITTKRAQKRLSVAEPTVADVVGISPTRVLVTAKKTGTTQLIIWDDQDQSQTIDVLVTADVTAVRDQLDRMFPGNKVEATASDDAILLSGHVDSLAAAEAAERVASAYSKKVVNLIEVTGGQQVMLQVCVAEVSRSATRALGVNYGYADGTSSGAVNVGQVNPFSVVEGQPGNLANTIPVNPSVTLFGTGQLGDTTLRVFLSALRENNLMRILAEPNLIAMSGQEASFLAGGEFPIPVPQSSSGSSTTITIEFKEFGVRLKFVPIVLGDGRIRLNLSPEVSDLDFTTAVRFSGFVVPGLTQRKVSTTVELGDGQSLAIAGLLNQNVTSLKQAVPLLGDLPVIGPMFRSVRYQRKETELVVLVTPRIVSPMNPDQVPEIPGSRWHHPDDGELFLQGDIGDAGEPMGRATPTTMPAAGSTPRRYIGSRGFATE